MGFIRSRECLGIDMTSDYLKLADDEITLRRDLKVIEIPEGTITVLEEGRSYIFVHEMGGDFTIRNAYGAMYRVAGNDADAIGKQVPADAQLPIAEGEEVTEEHVWTQIRKCYDPEIPVDIVELGLIYDMSMTQGERGALIEVTMTLTAPGCGMGQVLQDDVKRKVEQLPGVSEAEVELTFDPPWSPERMSEAARLETGML